MAQQAESGGVASEKGRESHGIRISVIDLWCLGAMFRARWSRGAATEEDTSTVRRGRRLCLKGSSASLDVLLVLQCIQVR